MGDAKSNAIQRITNHRAGLLWIATQGGLHRFDPTNNQVQSFLHDPADPASLGGNYLHATLEDRKGALWIATDTGGLDRMDRVRGSFEHFRNNPSDPDSLSSDQVYSLFEDGKGRLWIGTANGLNRLDIGTDGKVRFQRYPFSGESANKTIATIQEDDDGHLWLAVPPGIGRFDPETGSLRVYTKRDGIAEGGIFIGSSFHAADGTLYFGGTRGLTAFKPREIRDNPHPPAVVITDFQIFNKSVRGGKTVQGFTLPEAIETTKALSLSYQHDVFSLEFAALHYASPESNQYSYKLEGFDKDWISTTAERRLATYTNLDPGDYVFRVKAANKDGVWNQEGSRLKITITPPLWKTWWFRIGLASLLIGGAILAYRSRIHALEQRQAMLEQQVTLRTAEAMQQKDEVLRQKNEVERQKESVELAHHNIALLSDIGREITSSLDRKAIMQSVQEHLRSLMDGSGFAIGLYDPDRGEIAFDYAMAGKLHFKPYRRSMQDPHQFAVWCIRHKREVFINDIDAQFRDYFDLESLPELHAARLEDGSSAPAPKSALYVPMLVGERVLGVVCVQSVKKDCYQEVHLDMVRTLAAYAAVGLDNADAYHQLQGAQMQLMEKKDLLESNNAELESTLGALQRTQKQLVEAEKMAALGGLVAGVAHEINTPVGVGVTAASSMLDSAVAFAQIYRAGKMKKADLEGFLADSQETSQMILDNLARASDLIQSFKQVAVTQSSESARRFKVNAFLHEILDGLPPKLQQDRISYVVDCHEDIEIESFPGAFLQVVSHIVGNAIVHGYDAGQDGVVTISVARDDAWLMLVFSDAGKGIEERHIDKVFDPFFTTRRGTSETGSSGLGLHIVYNLVTQTLRGSIRCSSVAGKGTEFVVLVGAV